MRSIQLLAEEHKYIEKMLLSLQRILDDLAHQGRVGSDAAAPLLALFEYFAEGTHQRKEEAVLFSRLLDAAPLEEKVTLARLLGEHEDERRLMRDLRPHLFGAIIGVPDDASSFLRIGRLYIEQLAAHVAKENRVLFPMALSRLEATQDQAILRGFARVDAWAGIPQGAIFDRIDRVCGVILSKPPRRGGS